MLKVRSKAAMYPINIYVVYFGIEEFSVSNIFKNLGVIFHLHWWKSGVNSIDIIGSVVT